MDAATDGDAIGFPGGAAAGRGEQVVSAIRAARTIQVRGAIAFPLTWVYNLS
jgi:hypothetical protein